MTSRRRNPAIAVVGGGLGGLAAAVALRQRGCGVELFEQRKQLGGRAASFRDPQTGGLVDHCRHVALGCCTNLADFCRRIAVADGFHRYDRLHFFGPEGTRHDFAPSRWLPAPLHLGPALMRLGYLSFGERAAILRAMLRLANARIENDRNEETIGAWLRRHGQSDRVIEQFWSVVLVSALSETVDRASLAAAKKVFLDGFLASRGACRLEVPKVPLGEMFDRPAAAWLREHDVAVHLGTRIRRVDGDARRATGVVLPDGSRREFDFVVVAVPWRGVRALFPPPMSATMPALDGLEKLRPAPITAVHLWFDRPITPLPHAVLVGKLSPWLFSGGEHVLPGISEPAHYYQLVVSASHELTGRHRTEVLAEVRRDLEAVWPDTRAARLLHWRVIRQPAAVFSPRPGQQRLRPAQQTPIQNLLLAGDWTATGWPATMEGAVRSGYLAAEGILGSSGSDDRVLVPDFPRSRLVRYLVRP